MADGDLVASLVRATVTNGESNDEAHACPPLTYPPLDINSEREEDTT